MIEQMAFIYSYDLKPNYSINFIKIHSISWIVL